MKRQTLYSSSIKSSSAQAQPEAAQATSAVTPNRWSKQALRQRIAHNHIFLLWSVVGLLALMLALSLIYRTQGERKLTQDDINAAVLKTLETTQLPSAAAKAYDLISPSVVRVVGYGKDKDKDGEASERSVGTGVVIVDKGIILTNLHVVQGAETIHVTFADGMTTTASIKGVQPENDLAVHRYQRPARITRVGSRIKLNQITHFLLTFGRAKSSLQARHNTARC